MLEYFSEYNKRAVPNKLVHAGKISKKIINVHARLLGILD